MTSLVTSDRLGGKVGRSRSRNKETTQFKQSPTVSDVTYFDLRFPWKNLRFVHGF